MERLRGDNEAVGALARVDLLKRCHPDRDERTDSLTVCVGAQHARHVLGRFESRNPQSASGEWKSELSRAGADLQRLMGGAVASELQDVVEQLLRIARTARVVGICAVLERQRTRDHLLVMRYSTMLARATPEVAPELLSPMTEKTEKTEKTMVPRWVGWFLLVTGS